MGVFRLKSFIESKACPGGAYTVNVIEEIKKYVRKFRRPAIIVIDVFPSLFMLDPGGKEVLSGGRHILLEEHATMFYQKLIDAGAELVFFVDGRIKEAKFQRCSNLINGSYECAQELFEALRAAIEVEFVGRIMTLYYTSYQFIIKKFAKVFVTFENECDADIAAFANRNRALAVLTNDTDFLIFRGDWDVWMTEGFDFETYKTLKWSKWGLRRKLGLKQEFMPIFATLCGTDFMPKDCVKHIHEGLGKGFFHVALAFLVRRYSPNGTPLSEKERNSLLELIYKDQQTSFSKSQIEISFDESIDFYSSPDRQTCNIKEAWLRQHLQQTQSSIVYIIMHNSPVPFPQHLIDAQQPNVKQFCELALPLFQRQMGIVLRDKDSRHKHEVWFKPNHDEPFDRRFVELIRPNIDMPPIEEIVLSNEVKIETKLDILCDILLPGNEEFRKKITLLDMKHATFVPILKICYLKENNQISTDETDVLLLSFCASIKMDSIARQNETPPILFDPKAFWIGMVYNQIHTVFLNCLIVSGLYEYIQPEIYDGFIFHKMYTKFFEKSPEERSVLIEPVKEMRIYTT